MKDRVAKTYSFLKTTAIGGLIFLLPLAVIGALLQYVYGLVVPIYEQLEVYVPVSTPTGVSILFLVAVAILLAICFLCGLAARRAIARKFSQTIEKHLVMVFPKYAIYKDIVAGNLGGDDLTPSLVPVTLHLDDMIRIGYEAGRTAKGQVIVYLPGSPDPWIGSVALVAPGRVQAFDVDFNETAAICERLGRDSEALLSTVMSESESPDSAQSKR